MENYAKMEARTLDPRIICDDVVTLPPRAINNKPNKKD